MIADRDIICFCNDWDSDPLSKKHIMVRLARRNRILWVNSIGNRNPEPSIHDLKRVCRKLRQFASGCRRVDETIYVLSPVAIPFHGSPAARRINQKFLAWHIRLQAARLGFGRPITWSFLPSSADVVGRLGEDMVIYHCVDEFSEFTGTRKQAILDMERRLIERADLQFVSSTALYDAKRRHNPNTYLITHGVDVDHFRKACSPGTIIPQDIGRLSGPVIGFIGLVADWVDLELIRFMAERRPDWSFALIGKVAVDCSPLRGLRNVHLLGRRSYQDLPGYCKKMDVSILPFVINKLTVAANPLKLREYLAAGLPVVASAIPEAEKLSGQVRVASGRDEFLRHVDSLLQSGLRGPRLSTSQTMESESWDQKVEEMSTIVSQFASPNPQVGRPAKVPSILDPVG